MSTYDPFEFPSRRHYESRVDTAVEPLNQGISRGVRPRVKELILRSRVPGEGSVLSCTINGIHHVMALDMRGREFRPHAFGVIRSHLSTLVALNLLDCANVTSAMHREILCSCSHLSELQSADITAKNSVKREPWICHNLRKLQVCFVFGETELGLQRRIFERLSRLIMLEELCIGGKRSESKKETKTSLRLRLNLSPSALSTLKRFKRTSVSYTEQYFGGGGLQWMLQNWSQLEEVQGRLSQDSSRHISSRRSRTP
ncbi:hypothetical protein BGX26_005059, partial [Mortierella sp. AD094]